MASKSQVMFGMTIGALIGGYLPGFFGAGVFSWWSIVGSLAGGFLGIYFIIRILR